MNKLFSIILVLFVLTSCKDKPTYVQLDTTEGEIILKLYDETPLHKENFAKLVEEGYYEGILFHRVMNEFMVQAGDPNSIDAKPKVLLGNGGPDYTVDAEFRDSIFHKKGALAMARGPHPEKASAASQFYIVEGKKYTDKDLDGFENRPLKSRGEILNKINFTDEQREYYKTIGGAPFLDQNYTVFGEVVTGMDVVASISDVKVDRNNRPIEDIRIIKAEVIKFKEKKQK